MNATYAKLALPEPVVIPESIDQCHDLLGRENVIPMGDFARDAGFEETVLVSPQALRQMVGKRNLDGPPARLTHAVIDALSQLRATMKRYPGRQSLVVVEQDEDGLLVDVLVRKNLSACPPFTLITLQ